MVDMTPDVPAWLRRDPINPYGRPGYRPSRSHQPWAASALAYGAVIGAALLLAIYLILIAVELNAIRDDLQEHGSYLRQLIQDKADRLQ